MKIQIPSYLSSNTYSSTKMDSVSFITDLKNNIHYILMGDTSKLWNFIINSQDYNEILSFAKEQNIQNVLNPFLAELKYHKLIEASFIDESQDKKYLKYSIKENSAEFKHFNRYKLYVLKEKLNTLYSMRLSLNYTCNLNCKQCCNPKDLYSEMTFEQAKSVIDEAIDLGLSVVSISGGECTINKDFLKIAQYVRSKFLELAILTNAQKLYDDDELLNNIINIYPSEVQISLYSMDPEVHDNLTGMKGSHYKTLSVIKKLREHNIKVTIACVQFSYNKESYIEVKKFADSIGCNFTTDCVFIYNEDNNNLDAKLSDDDIYEYYLNTIDIKSPRKRDGLVCSGGIDRFEIMPNMDINPCTYFYYTLGNYNKVSLKEVRETTVKEFHKIFKKENLKDCFKYEYCQYCFGCPKFCKSNEKDFFLKKNEILCEDARAYYKAYLKLKELKSTQVGLYIPNEINY